MTRLTYTERAWAADIVARVAAWASARTRRIARASADQGLGGGARTLFPDVLLMADLAGTAVLQGWELKFPDTALTDPALLANAAEKANRLGLPSFLVWNVDRAELHERQPDGSFGRTREWGSLGIGSRLEVRPDDARWHNLLSAILSDLSDLFEVGAIRTRPAADALTDALFADTVEWGAEAAADALARAMGADAVLQAEVEEWWDVAAAEFGEKPGDDRVMRATLARTVLAGWVNRLVFAHCLKRMHAAARTVDRIEEGTTPAEAAAILRALSDACDFAPLFAPAPAEEHVGSVAWEAVVALNLLLRVLLLEAAPQAAIRELLDRSLAGTRRKAAGQYATPEPLARLLVGLAMRQRAEPVLDPCCGSGTIARAVLDLKRASGQPLDEALAGTWASDRFAAPLQAATLALTPAEGMDLTVRLFREDVFALKPGHAVQLAHPNTGERFSAELPRFGSIVSNLPFVRFETVKRLNPAVDRHVVSLLVPGEAMPPKSDLFARIGLHLASLVREGGRVGLIVSNAWLATEWGAVLRDMLRRRFRILSVVTSGRGRWFGNADVVTTLLILERLPGGDGPDVTDFVVTRRAIGDWGDAEVDRMARAILLGRPGPCVTVRRRSREELDELDRLYLAGWSACFCNLDWLRPLAPALVRVSECFDVGRGERRGCNALFYPAPGHGIEPRYLRPVLRTSASIGGFVADPDREAFCCEDDEAVLRDRGDGGALAWIERFRHKTNESGELLPAVLGRGGRLWYSMRDDAQADLVLSVNPDRRIFVARMRSRGFVDQRLMRFTARPGTDLSLSHALLNSVVGMFLIEAAGFGRGLGALDLNPTKLAAKLRMLDPRRLPPADRGAVTRAFEAVTARAPLPVPKELADPARVAFDTSVLRAFGVPPDVREGAYDALRDLHALRRSAVA